MNDCVHYNRDFLLYCLAQGLKFHCQIMMCTAKSYSKLNYYMYVAFELIC